MLLQDMCGDAWIQKSNLTNWRPLGEGAFATVQQCMLKQDAGALVCLLLLSMTLATPARF